MFVLTTVKVKSAKVIVTNLLFKIVVNFFMLTRNAIVDIFALGVANTNHSFTMDRQNPFKIVIRRTKVAKQYLLSKHKQLKLKICKS